MENSWTRFSQKIRIKAPVQKVYDAWTSQDELEKWFLRTASFKNSEGVSKKRNEPVIAGDTYLWMWHGYPDEFNETGSVTRANGKDEFAFTFGKCGNVTVKLTADRNTTMMEIIQEDIPTDEKSKFEYYVGCSTGWTFFRLNLKSYLEGGLDLRNKEFMDNMD